VELLRGFLADSHQDRTIVRADLLFLTYMVHNFNAWQSRGDFLATASLLALMRRDRDALRNHVDGESLRFVEQALLFDRDILKALFGGSAEELAFEPGATIGTCGVSDSLRTRHSWSIEKM
jgi:hypothetical protein